MNELSLQEQAAIAYLNWTQKALETGEHLYNAPVGTTMRFGESEEDSTEVALTEENRDVFRAGIAAMLGLLQESPMAKDLINMAKHYAEDHPECAANLH